ERIIRRDRAMDFPVERFELPAKAVNLRRQTWRGNYDSHRRAGRWLLVSRAAGRGAELVQDVVAGHLGRFRPRAPHLPKCLRRRSRKVALIEPCADWADVQIRGS